MQNDMIRVLIADDRSESCHATHNFLRNSPDIEVCGLAGDGEDALEKIYLLKPDVVLLDVMMPRLDGISVLRRLKKDPPKKKPKVIMLTGANKEQITSEAFTLGASYYLIKPTTFETLCDSINMVYYMDDETTKLVDKDQAEHILKIREMLLKMQVPTHLLGYTYIKQALKIMIDEPYLGNLSKQVYSRIAIEDDTTVECVERTIRCAIKEAVKHESATFREFFMDEKDGAVKRPTNAKFLTKLAEEIRIRLR